MNEFAAPVPKEEIYRDILIKEFEGKALPEAIFVLSGGIEHHEYQGYRSPSYVSGGSDHTGLITGGRARPIAAAEIAATFPEITIVTTSRSGEESDPSDAEVMARELIKRGVESGQIELEEKSTNTLTELVEMIKIAIEKDWQHIAILTNGYHVPRVRVMYDKLETIEGLCSEDEAATIKEFKQSGTEVGYISAEDIMANINHHYKKLVEAVEATEGYKSRLEAEQRGIDDLEAGRYKVRR